MLPPHCSNPPGSYALLYKWNNENQTENKLKHTPKSKSSYSWSLYTQKENKKGLSRKNNFRLGQTVSNRLPVFHFENKPCITAAPKYNEPNPPSSFHYVTSYVKYNSTFSIWLGHNHVLYEVPTCALRNPLETKSLTRGSQETCLKKNGVFCRKAVFSTCLSII